MKNKNKKIGCIILLAAISKGFGVGDTVYVWFKDSSTLNKLPQARVVASCEVDSSTNVATVLFTTGESVRDGATTEQRVFTTQALCANAIIDAVILEYDACAVLNSTTSGASTAGAATLGLTRSNA